MCSFIYLVVFQYIAGNREHENIAFSVLVSVVLCGISNVAACVWVLGCILQCTLFAQGESPNLGTPNTSAY